MAIRCRNGEVWPNYHFHDTVEQSRLCWGGKMPSPAGPFSASVAASPAPAPEPKPSVRMVSEKQLKYIEDLDGDVIHAHKLTWDEAHEYITRLENEKKAKEQAKKDPRLRMIEGMLDMIPDGCYATAADGEGGHVDFLRIARSTHATRKYPIGTLKVQTQHSEQWRVVLVKWPSGNWSLYDRRVLDPLLLVIADSRTCGRRYGIELQRCQKCGKKLTDDRSRHYLIGPECETKEGGAVVIEEVDNLNDGLSFEQLVHRGLPTRVWQEAVV